MSKRGLGRNLSALLGSTTISLAAIPESPSTLKLSDLQPGKYQPRQAIEESSLEELAASIKKQGVLQPLVVRAINDGRYEIIAGERRWRACQLAELTEVPVIVKQVDDETAMAMALVENLQREDLNPMDQARAMARLTQEFALTHQQIADLLSKSRTNVTNYLRLLSLTTEVRHFVETGDIDMGHARALLILEGDQQIQAAKLVIANQLSVRETEKLVHRVKQAPKIASEKPQEPPLLIQQQLQALTQTLKTKITIRPDKKGRGHLAIQYNDWDSLAVLLARINITNAVS